MSRATSGTRSRYRECPKCRERLIRPGRNGEGLLFKIRYVFVDSKSRALELGCWKCGAAIPVEPGAACDAIIDHFRLVMLGPLTAEPAST